MGKKFLFTLFVLQALQPAAMGARMLRFASPLQSLTIPDRETKEELETNREGFLPKFKAGLKAEMEARRSLAAGRTADIQAAATSNSKDWAERTIESEQTRREREDEAVEQAFDNAVSDFTLAKKKKPSAAPKSTNGFQFVGVVNHRGAESGDNNKKPITWYARSKPAGSKWSVRLVHVNQDAIVKDLFSHGKVDIFAKYKNTGKFDEETKAPIVTSTYEVRERSWKNLWNFSPKHFFTDPSGMYWRERRLRPGLYTDGVSVYESSYRYEDGRNGMHRVSGFQQFLGSKSIKNEQKEKILKRLQQDAPDIVLEL